MGGIGFLLVIFLYIVVSVKLVAKAPTLKYKIVALLAVLLIPSADAIYGRIKLHQMCEADGGLRIFKVEHNVEGVLSDGVLDDFAIKNSEYKFSEAEVRKGIFNRLSLQNGKLVLEENVQPRSKYKSYITTPSKINKLYWRQDAIIETYPESEVMVRDTLFGFRGGWVERFIARFAGANEITVVCNKHGLSSQQLLIKYLKGDK